MKSKKTLKDLIGIFVRISNKYSMLSKKTFDYGSGERLFPSEIHCLRVINQSRECNITELSEKLGITKSAASQTIIKLNNKSFLEKYKSHDNEKNILLKLTDKGLFSLKCFEEFRNDIFKELIEEIGNLEEKDFILIHRVFNTIDKHLDKKLEQYK